MRQTLPFADKQSFAEARRGFIAPLPQDVIRTEAGAAVWDPNKYGFIKEEEPAPDTVNPSLWRQSQLVNISGLFQVTERIYQVRNCDISNMTIIEGEKGIIVVDPLVSAEVARAVLSLYFQHRPRRSVTAVIYSHSHIDHFGGVRGVVSQADVQAGKVAIYCAGRILRACHQRERHGGQRHGAAGRIHVWQLAAARGAARSAPAWG